jgi:3-hydroxybutyryl-CoA dehydrogenase
MTRRIAVVGGGTMGVGIAYVSAMAGGEVAVVEPDNARAAAFGRIVGETVLNSIKRGKLDDSGGKALIARITRMASVEELPAGFGDRDGA